MTLERLAGDYWEAFLHQHPTFATAIGDRRFDHRLEDNAPEARAAWRSALQDFEHRLESTDDGDPVTRAALAEALKTDKAHLDADLEAFNVDPMDGPQVDLLNIPSYQPIRSAEEADALLARWRDMPRYLDRRARTCDAGWPRGASVWRCCAAR